MPRRKVWLPKQTPTELNQLLQYVAKGEQDKAEELIKRKKNLLLRAGKVKDLSGREFKQITAFQYALWALDWHMWTMIQKYLPTETQAQQLRELKIKGTEYGQHFSLLVLINAIKRYLDLYNNWCGEQWLKLIGAAQNDLPIHVVNEYCRRDRPFKPCPSEWESKLPRTQVVRIHIWELCLPRKIHECSWFGCDYRDRVGLTHAYYRGSEGIAVGRNSFLEFQILQFDLQALRSLRKTRKQQLAALTSDLRKPLVVEALNFVGLFKVGINLVCAYERQTNQLTK